MRIDKISYQGKFSINSQFLNETMGAEGTLDVGETMETAIFEIRTRLNKLAESFSNTVNLPSVQLTDYIPPETVHTYFPVLPKEVNLQDEQKEITIENAKTLEELTPLKNGINQGTKLYQLYMNKLKELTK